MEDHRYLVIIDHLVDNCINFEIKYDYDLDRMVLYVNTEIKNYEIELSDIEELISMWNELRYKIGE